MTTYEESTCITHDEEHMLPWIPEHEVSCISYDDNDNQSIRKYMGEVIFEREKNEESSPKSHPLDDIVFIPGKIIFFIDGGASFYIEDNTITQNACATLTNNYESFLGKKSILKEYYDDTYSIETYCSYTLEIGEYYTRYIAEYIHDGITTFDILDCCVQEITYRCYDDNCLDLNLGMGGGYLQYVYPREYPFLPKKETEESYIPFSNDDVFVKPKETEYEYEYYNDVIVYSAFEQRFLNIRLPLEGIEVTKGKITFFISDGSSFFIEDDSIIHNIYPDGEKPITDSYKSFFGKKSILANHCDVDCCNSFLARWTNTGETYDVGPITECIHDGVTSFIVTDECVKNITLQN